MKDMTGIVRSRTIRIALFALLAVGALQGLSAQTTEVKVAVVDLELVVAQSVKGKELQAKLEQFQGLVEAEGKNMVAKVNELRQRITDGANALSEDRLSELQKELEDATIAVRRFQDDKTREGEKIQTEGLRRIEAALGPIFEQVQQELGYDLILNQVPGVVLFASEALDITPILVERFNAGTAAAPAPAQ
jgi:Skp family chaperone for outer membrane proteins